MAIPEYINEIIKIVENLPEKDNFAKLAKSDLLIRINEFLSREHGTIMKDVISKALNTSKGINKNYYRELLLQYIAMLIRLQDYKEALRIAGNNNIDPKYVIDVAIENHGINVLEHINEFPEKHRNYIIIRVWISEARKNNIDKALEEIMKLEDIPEKFFALIELARIAINRNIKEESERIIKYVEENLGRIEESYLSSIASLCIHIKALLNAPDTLEFFEKWRTKIRNIDLLNFVPELVVYLIAKNELNKAIELINSIEEKDRKDLIILNSVDNLCKKGFLNQAIRISLMASDRIILAQAYLIIAKNYDPKEKDNILAYIRLSLEHALKWFDENMLLVQRYAEKIKEEDKNYSKMDINQIILFHPQVSGLLRNVLSVSRRALEDLINALIEKELLQDALHFANYVCTLRKMMCDFADKIRFRIAIKEDKMNEVTNTLRSASGVLFSELIEILNEMLSDKDKLREILINELKYDASIGNIEKMQVISNILISNDWIDDTLNILSEISDSKIKGQIAAYIADLLLDKNVEKAEEMANEAWRILNELEINEGIPIANILAKVLHKLGKHDDFLEIIRKCAESKDPWSAGLILRNVFSS